MASSLNKAMLIGHLGDDVKMHYFDDSNSLGRFPVATNETYTNKQTGERITTTEWHNVVVRNKLAELCEKYLGKGDRVYVEGRIKTRQWEQDGIKKYIDMPFKKRSEIPQGENPLRIGFVFILPKILFDRVTTINYLLISRARL